MTMQTPEEFIAAYNITMDAVLTDTNPNIDDMPAGSSHWKCALRRTNPRKRMTVYFSQGPAILCKPTAADVLDCLASDAHTFDITLDFEDWARNLGFDPDSRRAERIYRTVQLQTKNLRRFLDDDAFETLLNQIERL